MVTVAIRLPDLEQHVDIDTADLKKAILEARAFGDAMSKALKIDTKDLHKGLSDLNNDLADSSRNSRQAADGMNAYKDSLVQVQTRLNAVRGGLANLRQDLANLDRDTKNVGKNFGAIADGIDRVGESAKNSRTHVRGLSQDLGKLGDNVGKAATNIRGVVGNFDDFDASIRRSQQGLRDYNDELGRLGQGGGSQNGPTLGPDFRDQADGANRAEHELNELREAASKLAATMAALEIATRSANERIDRLGSNTSNAEIEHLKAEVEELNRRLAELAVAAPAAARGVKKLGGEARDAAGLLALLSGASAVLNAAIAPEFIIKTSQIGTIFSAITGVVGALGAGIGQLVAGGVGLGAALAPILNLAGIIPSMMTGIALLGVTVKSAFNTDVTNEFTESIKAGKKELEELSNKIVTVIQGQTTPAFKRLVESAKELSPVLETGFKRMGTVVQQVMDDISGDFFLANPAFQDRFARLFDSAALQARNYGYVATNALFAVTTAATKGIPVAEKLSESMKDMSNRFLNFVRDAEQSGALDKMFEKGYQTLMRVVSMVGSLGTGLANLGKVAMNVGLDETILQSFERGTQGIRNFGRTYRDSLVGTFENAKGLITEVGQLLSQVARTIMLDLGQINLAPLVNEITGVVEILGKMALPAGDALVEGFTKILGAVRDARGPLINLSTVLSGVLTSLGDFGASIIPKLIGPLQQIGVEVDRFVGDMADVFTDLVPALADPFVQIVQSSRRMVTGIVEAVAPLVKIIAQPFADAFSLIQDTIGKTATQISGPLQSAFGDVLPALSDAFRDVVPAIGELIAKVIELVAAFSNSFGGAVTAVVGILVPIIEIFTTLATAAASLPDPIKALVVGLLALRLVAPIGQMIGTLAGHIVGLGGAIRGAYAGAGGGLAGLRAGLGSFITFLGGPWMLVLAGAATALTLFGMSQQDAKQQAAEYQQSLKEMADTMDQVTGAATALTTKKIGENLFDKGLIDDLERFGQGVGEATNAIAKGGEDLDKFKNSTVASFLAAVEASEGFREEINRTGGEAGEATSQAAQAMQELGRAGSFSMQSLAQAWASGNNSYIAYAQKIASETGMSVDSVTRNFEAIRSAVDRNVGGAASSISAFGDEIARVGEAGTNVRTMFENLSAGAADALRDVQGFSEISDRQLLGALDSAYARGIPVSQALAEIGVTGRGAAVVIAALGDAVDGSSGELTGMGDAATQIRDALEQVADEAAKGIPGAQDLAAAFGVMGDQASSAADKAKALQDILEIMNGGTKELQEAQFDWAASLDSVRAKIESLNTENAGFVQGINDSNGALDKNNSQHRDFRKNLEGMVDDYSMLNASVYQNTKASEGQDAALKAVYQSATEQRKAFTDTMQQMGFTETAANNLADAMGLIPEQVRLGFAMDGTDQLVQKQIANIIAQLEGIPEGKVTIDNKDGSMDEALAKMEELGYTVEKGANGKVTVTDNFASVRDEVNKFVGQITNIPEGKITIDRSEITGQALSALATLGYTIRDLPEGKVSIESNITKIQTDANNLAGQVANMPQGAITITQAAVTKESLEAVVGMGYTVSSLPNGQVVIASNAGEVQSQINGLADRVNSMPEGQVTVAPSEITKEAEQVLEAMGYAVVHMPNGQVTITSNAAAAASEVEGLKGKVETSMNGVIVIDSATTTNEAIGRLEELGYKIETTPDGDYIITDNTPEANSKIEGVKTNINTIPDGDTYITAETGQANNDLNHTRGEINSMPDHTSTINVVTSGLSAAGSSIDFAARDRTSTITVRQTGAGFKMEAMGDILAPMAKGGIARAIFNASGNLNSLYKRGLKQPMSNNIAQIVPPNTPRVIGDNLRRRELFMPIDPTNGRSINLLSQGAFEMGYDLVKRNQRRARAAFFADGGISTSDLRRNFMAFDRNLTQQVLTRATITGVLKSQSSLVADAVQAQSANIRSLMKTVESGGGAQAKGDVNFTFNQYNPTQVPASEMTNRGLQLAAAAGLLG